MSTAVEYRVTWRRADWSTTTKSKSKRFARMTDAQRFLDKLNGSERPDLGELVLLRVESRSVGTWQEVTL